MGCVQLQANLPAGSHAVGTVQLADLAIYALQVSNALQLACFVALAWQRRTATVMQQSSSSSSAHPPCLVKHSSRIT
jgi:hypothetical protein